MSEKSIILNEIGCPSCANTVKSHKNLGIDHSRQFRLNIAALIISVLLFIAGLLTSKYEIPATVIMLTAWLIAGFSVLLRAASNILKGHVFDENLLMSVASIGAIATGQYSEAAAVMIFYKLGILFEDMAVDNSKKSIASLLDLRPEVARLKTEDGLIQVEPETIKVNDILVVKPGERIPVDGLVTEGSSLVDTSSLTGESLPMTAEPGVHVFGGCVNKTGLITIEATNTLKQSAVTRILELVQDAASKKAPIENFITRFSKYYTPSVIGAALLTAVLPPLVTGSFDFKTWLYRAMIFLVISCPCALVVSVPLTFFAGIGKASSKGILVKGGNYLEALNKVTTVVFDKTGTLTEGVFRVSKIDAVSCTQDELLEYAAYAEAGSTHPIARSILNAYGKDIDESAIKSCMEVPGKGVTSIVRDKAIQAGNYEFLQSAGVLTHVSRSDIAQSNGGESGTDSSTDGTMVYIAVDGVYMGRIHVSDSLKKDAAKSIDLLRKTGIERIIMLTGDAREPAEAAARELNLDEFHNSLLPHQKVELFEKIKKSSAGSSLFVGDGINDAPVLALADIGVSMGGIGSDAAIEASDIVLMSDEPSRLADVIRIASITRSVALQNIIFALSIKILVLLLGFLGISSMWEAVFADVGVTLLAVLNTLRIRYMKI